MNRLFALALVIVLAACERGQPNYSGQYVGTVLDTVGGSGEATITLAQSRDQLTGAWQISFDSGKNSGFLQGTVSGSAISAQLYPSRPDVCPFDLVATRSGDLLKGNYAASGCPTTISGTFTGVKQ